MTNVLVGEIYSRVLDGVIDKSRNAFEEFGVPVSTLEDLESDWKRRLTSRNVAPMPWDPKPEPVQHHAPAPAAPSTIANGLTPTSYSEYENPPANGAQIKQEYGGLPSYSQGGVQPQGGAARAAQLMQAQYGTAASASVSAMQRGSGLALPGQQQSKPQGLQLPAQSPPPGQHQYLRQQQQQLQQQQAQPRIKVESDSPHLTQTSFQQQTAQPNYSQTDGADDGLAQWQEMLAARRAMHAAHGQQADRMMRDLILQHSAELESGLMMPLDDLPSSKRLKRTAASHTHPATSSGSSIPQLDGLADADEPEIKDEEVDADAINSDLDDSSDDGRGPLGDDDDENIDSILCTYDKVQRVKNKWKCTLKDGIMSANGKEWIFAKGMGEFEW